MVKRGALENRLDANTYHIERVTTVDLLKKSRWEVKPLKLVANFSKNIVSSNPKGLPYIGLENIESNLGVFIETSDKESFGTAVKFDKGKVLFPKLRPYLNKVYYTEFEGICSTEFHVLDSVIVCNEYLSHFLRSRFVVNQTKWLMSGNTLPRLQTADIENLLIPIPSLDAQLEIVNIFNQAYDEKFHKETEAKELLASIDAYLLEQLGVVLPDKVEEKNVFYVPFSKVQGGRFDPFYNRPEFDYNNEALLRGKYKLSTLKEVSKNLIKGRLPKDSEKEGSCKVVQINSVKTDGSIDLEDLLTAKPIFTQNQLLQQDDILIVITGATIGKISFWQYEGEYYLGGDIVKFQCNEVINPYYIYSYLRTHIIQTEIKRNITGATNGHLSPSDINNFKIPLPPFEIQTEIANHIRNIRERAKTLETEAKKIIEKVKADVEKIISG